MHFVLDNIAEAIGRSRLAARKAAKSPGRRAALQTILAFGVAGTAYGLYRGTRIGIADKVTFTDLGLDKLPMNDLMLQRSSLYDVAPVELIEYADIDLNLQHNDETLRYVDKETGEDLDAMLAALLDAQQEQLAAPVAPIIEPEAQVAALTIPEASPRLAPSDLPASLLAPLPGLRSAQNIPKHRSVPDLVPKNTEHGRRLVQQPLQRSWQIQRRHPRQCAGEDGHDPEHAHRRASARQVCFQRPL